MRQKRAAGPGGGEKTIRDIRRVTRRQYSAEEKIRIVLDGLRGEDSIYDFENGDKRMTIAQVKASLALPSAKAWGDEKSDPVFWDHVNTYGGENDIEIKARRWVENLNSADTKTKRGAQRGVRAPPLKSIKIMGGFIDDEGNEHVAEHKLLRPCEICERGFS